jgi:hypothetical protein
MLYRFFLLRKLIKNNTHLSLYEKINTLLFYIEQRYIVLNKHKTL